MISFLKPNEEMDWKNQVCGFSRCYHTLKPWQPTKSKMSRSPALWRWAAVTHLAWPVTAHSLQLSALLYRRWSSHCKSRGSWQRLILPRRGVAVIGVGLEWHWGAWILFGYRLSAEVLEKKILPLFYPKASITGEWAGLALMGGPSKTEAAFL